MEDPRARRASAGKDEAPLAVPYSRWVKGLLIPVAAAMALAASASGATPAARNGRIAYAYSAHAQHFQIYSVSPAGKQRRQLTRGHAGDSKSPAYSPDGKRILFTRLSNRGESDLWLMSADGTRLRRLTWTKRFDEDSPVWSPDGKEIAFAIDAPPQAKAAGIWIENADGTHLRRLTKGGDANPSWSPDGSQIAFDRAGGIWTVAASGGTPTQVAASGKGSNPPVWDDSNPAWSPDGQRIVFVGDANESGHYDLWILELSAGPPYSITRLTNTAFDEDDPAWSPDGSQIVYDGASAATSRIGVMSSDGTHAHFITRRCHCLSWAFTPAWQPLP